MDHLKNSWLCQNESTEAFILPTHLAVAELIFMHSVCMSLKNSRGSCGIRFFKPALRMRTVAFIKVRAMRFSLMIGWGFVCFLSVTL